MKFTAVIDESGSPHLPASKDNVYFSVGLLIPEYPDELRARILLARQTCPDDRVRNRGFFHASEDSRESHRFLAAHLKGTGFHSRMVLADKRAAEGFHRVNKSRDFHRNLVREIIRSGVSENCRKVDMLVGAHPETLRSELIVREILKYHETLQILEAVNFPYGQTVRTRVDKIHMVVPKEEPLMDVVDYLIWAHQRQELRDDETSHLQIGASMMRTAVGGAHTFPGVWRRFVCSTWSPKDPLLERLPFRWFDDFPGASMLDRTIEGLESRRTRSGIMPTLDRAHMIGLRILKGDKEMDTLLSFGEALFEVLDSEAVPLRTNENEFCTLKKGAAVCFWLKTKKMHRPPIAEWEKMLEEFIHLVTNVPVSIRVK